MQQSQDPMPIFIAKAANGIGNALMVSDFRDIILQLNTSGTTTAVVKFQVSYQKDMPDFSAAQSPTNKWDYVEVVDLEDHAAIDGDTGITFAGADDNRILEMDVNGANWINAIVSGYSAGAIYLDATAKNNNG